LRAYYDNKAPVVIHLNADWLKEYVKVNRTELIPNIGFSNKETTKVQLEKKEYRNLDGLIKFINITMESNRDVYFVTARKAIEWMRLMKRLDINTDNETVANAINELFDEQDCSKINDVYTGECSVLKQTKPDYDKEESFTLDDSLGEELKKKLKIEPNKRNSLLTLLQTEVLFVNQFVAYFLITIAVILILIIINDKFF
jgi:hypothetical protein